MTTAPCTRILNNGLAMPVLGMGTYRMRDEAQLETCMRAAFTAGYRMIDTASVYRNEEAIGRALKRIEADDTIPLERSDIFITSKLAPRDQGYDACLRAVEASIKRLDVDYIDLFLIHWPGTQGCKPHDPRNAENRAESYRALEALYKQGRIRSIGVSNYTLVHLQQLLAECTVKPAVLQVEIHPLCPEFALAEFCREHQIALEAYSSLGEGALIDGTRPIAAVQQAAEQYGVSEAQILLRWALQRDLIVIPKSTNPERVAANARIFDFTLSDQTMASINAATDDKPAHHFCWDPTHIV